MFTVGLSVIDLRKYRLLHIKEDQMMYSRYLKLYVEVILKNFRHRNNVGTEIFFTGILLIIKFMFLPKPLID